MQNLDLGRGRQTCAAVTVLALAAGAMLGLGAPTAEARRPQSAAPTQDARAAAAQAQAAIRAEREFARAAARLIAHGQRSEAETLARARGAGDSAALAVLAGLEADRGRVDEAIALVQLPGAANAVSAAALEWGRLLLLKGRKAEARRVLSPIASSARSATSVDALLRAGGAARALGIMRTAEGSYRMAAAAAKDDPAVNTAWGELFLDGHDPGPAADSFRAALKQDPLWAPAHAGLARALADEDPAAAAAAAGKAIEIDPSLVAAHVFLAEVAADANRTDDARRILDRALVVNPRALDALAYSAALAFVGDRTADFDATVAKALSFNPAFSGVYTVTAAHAAAHYRYDDAVSLARKAVATESDNPRAHAALGLHLLRTGDEREARQALETAFRADAYDLVTRNLLEMLDSLDEFVSVKTGMAVVRMHPDEAPVLRHYAVPMVADALAQMSRRYGFEPRGPIQIEIFPKHDDFAVRTLGLPGLLGALGASFGRVVTLDSPAARQPPGSFNWQSTLWHEMAHVFTMQLSGYRVPRWLTEGISVWEEGRLRPEWARDSELSFARAYAEGKVLKLADLNAGFMRGDTIELAYFQASQVVTLLVEQHGEGILKTIVQAFSDGAAADAVLRKTIGQTLPELQAAFDARLAQRYAALGKALVPPDGVNVAGATTPAALQALAARHRDSYAVQTAVGQALATAGAREAAFAAYERAHALVPSATGPASPRALMAELAERAGDFTRASRELRGLIADDHTNIAAARRLVPLARRLGQEDAIVQALDLIVTIDPFDSAAHTERGRLAVAKRDTALAVREFRAALASGPVDVAPAHCDLAEALLLGGDRAESRREVLAALEIAPSYERAQELLLRIVDGK